MLNEVPRISGRKILRFWSPLAATWLMMAFEGPFLAAVIARLADPKFNLAAYGVALSFALIVESPIIMIISATIALAKDRDSYLKLRKFIVVLNGAITIFIVVINIPSIFNFLILDLVGLPDNIARLTHISTLILIPWPAAIGFRRFYQGVLIRNDRTRMVAYGTTVRLGTILLSAWFLSRLSINGAAVGSAALSLGVVMELLATRMMAHGTIRQLLKKDKLEENNKHILTYKYIMSFYYPLALSSILAFAIHPIVTFFMGGSRHAIESLAVLPVINSLIFIFRSIALSYQEAGIGLMGDYWENYRRLKSFALYLSFFLFALPLIVAYSDLSRIWFQDISGLSMELSSFAFLPLKILVALPAMTVFLSFLRSVAVNARRTRDISLGSCIEICLLITVLFISLKIFNVIGVIAAVLAYMIGAMGDLLFLYFRFKSARRNNRIRGLSSGMVTGDYM